MLVGCGRFRLNLLAKCLAFAIVALGLDLLWGYTGILSLGHGVFFGFGAYAMAMHLKLVSSGSRLPDFMDWMGLTKLPWFWEPFKSFGFAAAMGIIIPAGLALLLGFFTFRNRIRGVYFTILTQALVIITVTLSSVSRLTRAVRMGLRGIRNLRVQPEVRYGQDGGVLGDGRGAYSGIPVVQIFSQEPFR